MNISSQKLEVILAQPRGFCAGVERAVAIVDQAIEQYKSTPENPLYVYHEIVHNKRIVDSFKDRGVVFVDSVEEIPNGVVAILSAHGVAEKVENGAKARAVRVIDATCPLVKKVHIEAKNNERDGRQIILIGHKGHPEVEGTRGRVQSEVLVVSSIQDVDNIVIKDAAQLAYVTQTTLSLDDTKEIIEALKQRFPEIIGPELRDICYATQNRQNAIKELAQEVDMLIVLGSQNSSNSNRLRDLGESLGVKSVLIDDMQAITPELLLGVKKLGLTAGASAPEILVQEVIARLQELADTTVRLMDGITEKVKFKLPPELERAKEGC